MSKIHKTGLAAWMPRKNARKFFGLNRNAPTLRFSNRPKVSWIQRLKNYLTKNDKVHIVNIQPYTKGVANARKK